VSYRTISENLKQEKTSWRSALAIHPAAELLPSVSPDELRALGEDIIKNGLTSPIALWRASPDGQAVLLDGRNRLDAIELVTGKPVEIDASGLMAGDFLATDKVVVLDGRSVDPWAYVISANIHRRHLSAEQRQNLLIQAIARAPEKSDRQIAKEIGVDHKTIASARVKGETTGEISPVEKRIGKDGKVRKQPANKVKKAKKVKQPAEQPVTTTTGGDIGATSAGEVERLDARNKELENKCRQLEIKIEGLQSELEEAKTARTRTNSKRLSRAARWENAAATAFKAMDELLGIQQEEYEPWRDNLPENLQSSALSEKLEDVCNLDLEDALKTVEKAKNLHGAALSEKEVRALDLRGALEIAEDAGSLDLPRGFGRD
jgi:hypothetical protein